MIAPEASLPVDDKAGYVADLIDKQPQIQGLQSYEYLRNTGGGQVEDFIDGRIPTLTVSYPHLTLEGIRAVAQPLESALTTVAFGARDAHTAALEDTLEYRFGEVFMLDMARRMHNAESEAERAEAAEWFKLANENLYGLPKAEVFNALARDTITPLLETGAWDSQPVEKMRESLRSSIGQIDESTYEPTISSSEERS